MTERLRVVLDTNVFVSAFLSRNPTSPTQELIQRWLNDEFTLLICDALVDEVIEKVAEREIDPEHIIGLVQLLDRLAERVDVPIEAVPRVVQADPDDDVILACASLGCADYLVTYDPHFDLLGEVQGLKITKALPFLWTLRGSQSSE